jgi:hypothetical protein
VTPESEGEAARLGIRLIKVLEGATGVWQPFDRKIYGTMKSKADARWARLFAQSEIPVATKDLAAGLAIDCWDELAQDVILSAWHFDEAYGDDEDDDSGTMDDDNAFIDVEYGHNDLEEADLMLMTTTAADSDDDDE